MFIRKYCKYKNNAKGEHVCISSWKYKPNTRSLQNILQIMLHECLEWLTKTFRGFNWKTFFGSQDEDFWKISNTSMFLLKGISLKQSMIL